MAIICNSNINIVLVIYKDLKSIFKIYSTGAIKFMLHFKIADTNLDPSGQNTTHVIQRKSLNLNVTGNSIFKI